LESFSKSHGLFWTKLEESNSERVVINTGAIYDSQNKLYKLTVINETYVIDPVKRIIVNEYTNQEESDFELKVVILVYLTLAESPELSGEFVTEQMLPLGTLFFKGLHSLPKEKIINKFNNDIVKLRQKCLQLGAKEISSNGDLGMEFYLLPRFPMRMVYWKSDEEFPADIMFYFDKYADRFLYLDTILCIIKIFVKKLLSDT